MKRTQHGFTLVELAIVLVIIGLIIAGVLVGQDMIKAASVRATIGQVEKYNAALNTFRNKYNGLPGDLPATSATNFGMTTRSGAVGHGDGNRLLEGCSAGALVAGCETVLFWRDLSFAGLIPDSMTTATDALTQVAAGATNTVFPTSKLQSASFTVFSASGQNYYELAGITSTDASGVYTLTSTITPAASFAMDSKMDDGSPITGTVIALGSTTTLNVAATPAVAAVGVCVDTATNAYNNSTQAYAESPACQLRFRFN